MRRESPPRTKSRTANESQNVSESDRARPSERGKREPEAEAGAGAEAQRQRQRESARERERERERKKYGSVRPQRHRYLIILRRRFWSRPRPAGPPAAPAGPPSRLGEWRERRRFQQRAVVRVQSQRKRDVNHKTGRHLEGRKPWRPPLHHVLLYRLYTHPKVGAHHGATEPAHLCGDVWFLVPRPPPPPWGARAAPCIGVPADAASPLL